VVQINNEEEKVDNQNSVGYSGIQSLRALCETNPDKLKQVLEKLINAKGNAA
jgi:hypothetical protein